MKTFKKAITLTMAAALAAGLVACGDKKEEEVTTPVVEEPAPAPSEDVTITEAPETEAPAEGEVEAPVEGETEAPVVEEPAPEVDAPVQGDIVVDEVVEGEVIEGETAETEAPVEEVPVEETPAETEAPAAE